MKICVSNLEKCPFRHAVLWDNEYYGESYCKLIEEIEASCEELRSNGHCPLKINRSILVYDQDSYPEDYSEEWVQALKEHPEVPLLLSREHILMQNYLKFIEKQRKFKKYQKESSIRGRRND